MLHSSRITALNKNIFDPSRSTVVYWINREFRSQDNWSLHFAQTKAFEYNQHLIVIINLLEQSTIDYVNPFVFFVEGLFELKVNLKELNIPLFVSYGESKTEIPRFLEKVNASALVTDFFPLKYYKKIINEVNSKLSIPFFEIDSHNIVPCKYASPKQEFAAYTLRPKINKLLNEFLVEIPKTYFHPINDYSTFDLCNSNFDILKEKGYNKSQNSSLIINSGEKCAYDILNMFKETKLSNYKIVKNNPNLEGISKLSPFIHFGQISTQRIALEVNKVSKNQESTNSFLEELIVRKELSDNFCFYNSNYDSFDGFHPWAKKTLNEHRKDKRDYIYNVEQFENALTHDPAWNAAQNEMKQTGIMHGYMRMYWAKKILEWTSSPEEALAIGIYLNDKYSLDGYDPNGYVGLAWSIGGVHDRAWGERQVFGKIRFMNYIGLKRKFDIKMYEIKWNRTGLFY